MFTTRLSRTLVYCGLLLAAAPYSHAAIFDFETDMVRQSVPFANTVDSLSAAFAGSGSVCDSEGLFSGLSGHVLIQSLCGSQLEFGPISISFSSDIAFLSLDFATATSLNPLTLTAYEDSMLVGTTTVTPAVSSGFTNGEGFAVITGSFNNVSLSVLDFLAVDNVTAIPALPTPEPGAAGFVAMGLLLLAAPIGNRVFIGAQGHWR